MYILTLCRVNGNERHTEAQRDGDGWIAREKKRQRQRQRRDRGEERERERAEKREFHEMYPPMSGAARERPSDVRSITDEPGVHAPKRRGGRSAFFYYGEIESLIPQRTIPKMLKMSFCCACAPFMRAHLFVRLKSPRFQPRLV